MTVDPSLLNPPPLYMLTVRAATVMSASEGERTALRHYTFDLVVESARTTHGHPSGYCAAGALALIIAYIVQGSSLKGAIEQTLPVLCAQNGLERCLRPWGMPSG
jgi:hypothetical protein